MLEQERSDEQDVELQLEETTDRTIPHFTVPENATDDQIKEQIHNELPQAFWWLQQRFKELGRPLERFDIKLPDHTLTIYNWQSALMAEELEELKRALGFYATLRAGAGLKNTHYILIAPDMKVTNFSNEPANGYGFVVSDTRFNTDGLLLFPPARGDRQHRVGEVSNFLGTVLHEFGHRHYKTDTKVWQKFGLGEEISEPQRCITDYAKTNVEEDFCESLVAYYAGNTNFDAEKHQAIDSLREGIGDIEVTIERKPDSQLPRLPDRISYIRKKLLLVKLATTDIEQPHGE